MPRVKFPTPALSDPSSIITPSTQVLPPLALISFSSTAYSDMIIRQAASLRCFFTRRLFNIHPDQRRWATVHDVRFLATEVGIYNNCYLQDISCDLLSSRIWRKLIAICRRVKRIRSRKSTGTSYKRKPGRKSVHRPLKDLADNHTGFV